MRRGLGVFRCGLVWCGLFAAIFHRCQQLVYLELDAGQMIFQSKCCSFAAKIESGLKYIEAGIRIVYSARSLKACILLDVSDIA